MLERAKKMPERNISGRETRDNTHAAAIIAGASVGPEISEGGRRRHRLLQDHHHLAGFEAEFAVDREHASVIRAVIGVHVRDPLLGGVAGHEHLQHPRDAATAMAAEHTGVANLGIAIRAAKKIAQADDVITVPGYEEALEQH